MFDERDISSLLSERLNLESPIIGSLAKIEKGEAVFESLKESPYSSSIPLRDEFERIDLKLDFVDEALNKARQKIIPSAEPMRVAAVDVSSVKLGSIEKGILMAFRGCMVWKNLGRYHFYRYGPLISLVEEARSWDREDEQRGGNTESFFGNRAASMVRNKFERAIQRALVDVFKDSIILFDGSLTAGTPDNPARILKGIISAAWNNNNMIIGVSKETQVLAGGKKVTELLDDETEASIICLDDYMRERFPTHPIRLLGRVYIAKMEREGFTFRLDISTSGGEELDLKAVRLLAGNDLYEHGYPETLRLSHILASFTSNEILGMRRYISLNFGVEVKSEFDLRKILFGPFSS